MINEGEELVKSRKVMHEAQSPPATQCGAASQELSNNLSAGKLELNIDRMITEMEGKTRN